MQYQRFLTEGHQKEKGKWRVKRNSRRNPNCPSALGSVLQNGPLEARKRIEKRLKNDNDKKQVKYVRFLYEAESLLGSPPLYLTLSKAIFYLNFL